MVMGRDIKVAAAIILGLSVICTSSGIFKDIRCHNEERDALLKFKEERLFKRIPTPLDSLWDVKSQPDCCKWIGVSCHNLTGYALVLNISSVSAFYGDKLSPALQELKHLQYLDMGLIQTQIPSFLGSMSELRYLRVSAIGEIKNQFRNLSKLEYLDVSNLMFDDSSRSSSLEWLEGMPNLKYLNLNYKNLSMIGDSWGRVLSNLSSLTELHLRGCQLSGHLPLLNIASIRVLDLSSNYHLSSMNHTWIGNLTSLEVLDLSNNDFQGPILHDICKLVGLRDLNLRSNSLVGEIAYSIGNLALLNQLDLSFAKVDGVIPDSIGNLSSLVELDLSSNNITGVIPNSIGNLSSLVELDLSRNHITGVIPRSIGKLASLLELDLSDNRVIGKMPNTLCNLHSLQKLLIVNNLIGELPQCPRGSLHKLEYLLLAMNNLHGTVPEWLGDLPSLSSLNLAQNRLSGACPLTLFMPWNLTDINLSKNQLGGVINESHLDRLSKLTSLDISSNYFVIDIVNHTWVPPFQLSNLYLGSSPIVGHQFPLWLRTQTRLQILDLSNTTLKGPIPTWFWQWASTSPSSLMRLYLSHNQIEGHLPDSMPTSLTSINLSYNKLSGTIPPSFQTWMMDLSANNLSGPVPNLGVVFFFTATKNRLNGTLATTFFQASRLLIFDISENQITGVIPANLGNCSSLVRLMLFDNYIYGGIPDSIGYLRNLTSLHLKNNFLSGKLPLSLGNCSKLEVLDIGENYMSGNILPIMGNTRMTVISLGKNLFTGEIPFNLSHMFHLQVFEVSQNGFWGRIPTFRGMINQGSEWFNETDKNNKEYYNEDASYFMKQYYNEEVSLLIKGQKNKYGSILYLVTSIDLSQNNFQGEIPQELMKLPELMFLNLSHNRLTGKIPQNIWQLKSLESLDLSNNRLTGEIPISLSKLSSLAMLNLSYNRLQGRIPTGTQLDTFNGSSFANNLDLCGPQLGKQCPGDAGKQVRVDKISGSAMASTWFYMGIMCGFVVGFWVILGTLIVRRDLRISIFKFFDDTTEKLIGIVQLRS